MRIHLSLEQDQIIFLQDILNADAGTIVARGFQVGEIVWYYSVPLKNGTCAVISLCVAEYFSPEICFCLENSGLPVFEGTFYTLAELDGYEFSCDGHEYFVVLRDGKTRRDSICSDTSPV